jgi:hypothetical protein
MPCALCTETAVLDPPGDASVLLPWLLVTAGEDASDVIALEVEGEATSREAPSGVGGPLSLPSSMVDMPTM